MDDAPEVDEDLTDVWFAFLDLHQSRSYGFGPNPIQYSEIESWLSLNEVDEWEDRQWFIKLIKSLDSFWISQIAEKHKNGKPKTGNRRDKGERWSKGL